MEWAQEQTLEKDSVPEHLNHDQKHWRERMLFLRLDDDTKGT